MNDNFKLVEKIYHNRVAELPVLSSHLLQDALVRATNQILLLKEDYSELSYSQIESFSNKFSEALKIRIKQLQLKEKN